MGQVRDHLSSNYMSQDFQEKLAFLGIVSSPSIVRKPEGNGVAERFIPTLKENLLWVKTFEIIEELRIALQDFARRYDETLRANNSETSTPREFRP